MFTDVGFIYILYVYYRITSFIKPSSFVPHNASCTACYLIWYLILTLFLNYSFGYISAQLLLLILPVIWSIFDHLNRYGKNIWWNSTNFHDKTLHKLDIEVMLLSIIKNIYDKPSVNIILSWKAKCFNSMTLFADDVILYRENPKDSTKTVELINSLKL